MKIVKPSAEVFFHAPWDAHADQSLEPVRFLEVVGRTCYKSEDRITEDSASKFIRMLRDRGHHAMLEHCFASVKFVCDRGVSHELVRHRLASYAQECVVGSTKVHRKHTIGELFARQESGMMGREYNKRLKFRSMATEGVFVPNRLRRVMFKGVAPVFEVRTRFGYTARTTKSHVFLTPRGERRLGELFAGDEVFVNGRPSLVRTTDAELSRWYLQEGLCPNEIAAQLSVPYRSVLRRLKKMGIFVRRFNDKDKEKYNRNHTLESVEKMRASLLDGYKKGRRPWNKGLSSSDHPGVFRQAENLRTHHHNNGFGDENSNWRGGISRRTACHKKGCVRVCELCGQAQQLEVHHLDKNPHNNFSENLLKVCAKCHHTIENAGWVRAERAVPDTVVSVEYVGREPVFDMEMEGPNHNYVADGFVVHNSTRYCNYGKDKFGAEISVIEPPGLNEEQHLRWSRAMEIAEEAYLGMLENGCPPQIARSVLPTCLKTEIWASANLREWMHVFKLRCSSAAHPQIKEVMDKAKRVFAHEIPELFAEV